MQRWAFLSDHMISRTPHRAFLTIFIPLILILIMSCSLTSPTPTPMLQAPTLPPTWTPEPLPPGPTPTNTLTPTPRPTATPSCDLYTTLATLKSIMPCEQFAIHQNIIGGVSSLVVWFVDPELDPNPSESEIPAVLSQAKQDAAEISHLLHSSVPCAEILTEVINSIVVDSNYTGWFSGLLHYRDIPKDADLPSEEIVELIPRFTVGYERVNPPQSYTPGQCTWPEARQKIQNHFALERENVAFYFVVDENGPNVWAQWDGPTDPIMLSVNLANILMELECFSPEANMILVIVDEDGNAGLVGYIPQMDASQLQILHSE